MTESKNGKMYALIAAICYTILAVFSIIVRVISVIISDLDVITIFDITWWIIFIAYAAALFLKNNRVIVFASAVNILYNIYFLIRNFNSLNFFMLIAAVGFAAVAVLSEINNPISKYLWFLPGAFTLLGKLIRRILYLNFSYFALALDLIEVVALVFAGMWLSSRVTAAMNKPADSNKASSVVFSPDLIGGADKIKQLKELLDSDIITQEEFDEKKRQILGL